MAPISYAEAKAVSDEIIRRIRFARRPGTGRAARAVVSVGSVRRGEPWAYDLDFLVVASDALPDTLAGIRFAPARRGDRVVALTDPRAGRPSVTPRRRQLVATIHRDVARGGASSDKPTRIGVDLFLATPAEKAYALFHYTGSRVYNIRTRAFAKRRGWKLNQYGLFDAASGRRVRGSLAVRSERELAALLGVSYRPPDDRAQ